VLPHELVRCSTLVKTGVIKSKIDLFKDFIPKNIRIPKNLIAHKTIDYDIWHRRLGHPSKDVLRHVSEATGGFPKVNIPNEDKGICPGCAKGKMTQRTYPNSEKHAEKLFDLVHMDIIEFPTISYHKHKYVLNILDDHSSYGAGYLLAAKPDIFEAFKEFYNLMDLQDAIKIKQIRVDNEFVTKDFSQFCHDKGIILGPSAPYEHQQNGRIERFNRTIHEKSEAMRHMACLPPSWWEFSVQTAYVVYNRTPMRRRWDKNRNWKTPYEIRYGKKPNVSKFRTFACAAYVYCPKETCPNKQAPRSEAMIFIGYTQGMNAYRFMRTHNNSIATSSNAIFDERWFPCCSTSKPTVDVNNNDFEEDFEPSGSTPDDNVEDDDPEFPPPPNPPAPIEPQNDGENGEGDEGVRGGGEVPDQHGADEGEAGAIQPPPNPFNPVMEPEPAPIIRRSERARVPTQRPGNIYGDTPPAEIDRNAGQSRNIGSDIRWNCQIYGDQHEAGPSRQRQPARQQPRANNPIPDPPVNNYSGESMNGRGSVDYISQLAHEGGVAFLDYLLSQAPENKETV